MRSSNEDFFATAIVDPCRSDDLFWGKSLEWHRMWETEAVQAIKHLARELSQNCQVPCLNTFCERAGDA
jgi:hypothetical protein